jgi:hypothetical protein
MCVCMYVCADDMDVVQDKKNSLAQDGFFFLVSLSSSCIYLYGFCCSYVVVILISLPSLPTSLPPSLPTSLPPCLPLSTPPHCGPHRFINASLTPHSSLLGRLHFVFISVHSINDESFTSNYCLDPHPARSFCSCFWFSFVHAIRVSYNTAKKKVRNAS